MLKTSAAVALALAAMTAQANTVSYDFANALAASGPGQSGTPGLFDSNLGSLTGIDLRLDGSMATTLTVTNDTPKADMFKAIAKVALGFGSTIADLNALLGAGDPANHAMFNLTAMTAPQLYAAGASATFGPLIDTFADDLNTSLSALLADFSAAGGGQFGISCNALGSVSVAGGARGGKGTAKTTATCGATITYTYTATVNGFDAAAPEPGSLALVGAALTGIALVAGRRQA